METLDFAMRNYKDESFIAQYLSPKLMREFHLFAICDDDADSELEISAIHNDAGYEKFVEHWQISTNLGNREPNIQVYRVDLFGDRSLTLRHYESHRIPLGETTDEMLRHVARLWGYDVHIESVRDDGSISARRKCPIEQET